MSKCSENRVSTGDRNLDCLIQGGFPRGSLILLAGNPGVGKTVFGANFICKGVRDFGETGVYVSLAEDKETFYSNISRHFGINCEKCEKRGMCIFLDYATVKEEGISAMMESILEEIMKVGAKLLVIDSFTAMAQAFKEPFESRIILHTILGKIVRRMGCTTLLICEVPYGTNIIARGMEEFVADGVIILRASSLEERLFRDLEIRKLRGTFIKEREIPFTLRGGFKVIQPFKFEPVEKPSRCKPIPHPPGRFVTFSPDLNYFLEGGFKSGTTALLEIGDNVSFEQYRFSVILPIEWNFISNGQPLISIPSPGLDYKAIRANMIESGFTEEELNRLVRFVEFGYLGQINREPYVIGIEGKNMEEDLKTIVDEILRMRREIGKPLMLTLGANTFITHYGPSSTIKALNALSAVTRENSSLMLVLLKSGFERLGRIVRAMADTHLKIIREHGVIFLYGIKPRTPLFAVELDVSKGYPIPKLTPVV